MTPERWQRVKEVFQEALEKSAAERAAFLDHACAADPESRGEVEQLLADFRAADSKFLEQPAIANLRAPATLPDPYAGLTLRDRYAVDRQIARGGFGAVYLARDLMLSERPVVVKILLDHHQREWSRRKFREEIEALARID